MADLAYKVVVSVSVDSVWVVCRVDSLVLLNFFFDCECEELWVVSSECFCVGHVDVIGSVVQFFELEDSSFRCVSYEVVVSFD